MGARDLIRLTLMLGLLSAGHAWGDRGAEAEAKRHFDEGTKAFNLREFERAIGEYKAAYRASPYPVFLYNIAQAYRMLGEGPPAIEFYLSYLRLQPGAANRAEVEKHIRALEETRKPPQPEPPRPPVVGEPPPAPAIQAPPAPPPAAVSITRTLDKPAPTRRPLYKRWWLWVSVGAGIAVGGGAIALGVVYGSKSGPTPTMGQVPGN